MKIIIYQATSKVPFTELYKPLGSFDKLFFSNGINELDKSQIRVLLPDNLQEDESIFFVPVAWQKEFYTLLNNKFANVRWLEKSSLQKPHKGEIGSGWNEELARFYDEEVTVVKEWELIGQKKKDPEIDTKKISTLMRRLRKSKRKVNQMLHSLTDEQWQVGVFILVFIVILWMVLKSLLSQPDDKIQKVKIALKDNNYPRVEKLAEEWKQKNLADKYNPALIFIEELSKVEKWRENQKNTQKRDIKEKCFVVGTVVGTKKINTFYQITNEFYDDFSDSNEKDIELFYQGIMSKSFRRKNGKVGVWNVKEEKIDSYITTKRQWKKKMLLKPNWELVIPNATKNQKNLRDCKFTR